MALAQHISIQSDKRVNQDLFGKIFQTVTALLKRLMWHAKAYTTVLGIMLLTLASLGFLCIHWSGKNLTQLFQDETVVEQK